MKRNRLIKVFLIFILFQASIGAHPKIEVEVGENQDLIDNDAFLKRLCFLLRVEKDISKRWSIFTQLEKSIFYFYQMNHSLNIGGNFLIGEMYLGRVLWSRWYISGSIKTLWIETWWYKPEKNFVKYNLYLTSNFKVLFPKVPLYLRLNMGPYYYFAITHVENETYERTYFYPEVFLTFPKLYLNISAGINI